MQERDGEKNIFNLNVWTHNIGIEIDHHLCEAALCVIHRFWLNVVRSNVLDEVVRRRTLVIYTHIYENFLNAWSFFSVTLVFMLAVFVFVRNSNLSHEQCSALLAIRIFYFTLRCVFNELLYLSKYFVIKCVSKEVFEKKSKRSVFALSWFVRTGIDRFDVCRHRLLLIVWYSI